MKKILYIMTIASALMLVSCTNWLDVPPPTAVNEKELFETEEGFEEAVNGLYTSAVGYSLYGGVFTVELLDAMMQNYSYGTGDPTDYQETAAFDFEYPQTRNRFNMIWDRAYNTIANANLILRNIEEKRGAGLFHENIGEIVEAEALAVRAYIHLDMLRLYAPLDSDDGTENASLQAIPYVTEYGNSITPVLTASEAVNKVIADLTDAKELLTGRDPILSDEYVVGYPQADGSTGVIPEENITIDGELLPVFLRDRRHHMNYYAVCGTLARAYLWKATALGDTSAFAPAAENAQEIVDVSGEDNASKFYWTSQTDMIESETTNARDRQNYTELVMAFFMDNESQITELRNRFNNVQSGYFVEKAWLDGIYEMGTANVGPEDLRYKSWFIAEPNGIQVRIIKYLRNNVDTNNPESGNLHYLVAPAIRMSEMFYILAECRSNGVGGDRWEPLNTVRTARGIRVTLADSDDFTAELLKEYRKETYAEGQAFLNYKRLWQTIEGPMARTYDPSVNGVNYPKGIYHPTISDAAQDWLPTNETDNRIQ